MIVIYYKNADGVITQAENYTGKNTINTMKELSKKYNEEKHIGNCVTAYVEEIDDNSLIAYLLRRVEEKAKLDKEHIQYAIDCMNNAIDMLNDYV